MKKKCLASNARRNRNISMQKVKIKATDYRFHESFPPPRSSEADVFFLKKRGRRDLRCIVGFTQAMPQGLLMVDLFVDFCCPLGFYRDLESLLEICDLLENNVFFWPKESVEMFEKRPRQKQIQAPKTYQAVDLWQSDDLCKDTASLDLRWKSTRNVFGVSFM